MSRIIAVAGGVLADALHEIADAIRAATEDAPLDFSKFTDDELDEMIALDKKARGE